MSNNKRYYWLKLDENFFEDDTVAWLEEQKNGKDYVIFYLKLCLKSLKDEGYLIRYVGNTLIPYDVPSLAKLTNMNEDTVRVAMEAFVQIGLVETTESGELYLSQINEMIGTETDSAKRMRKHRIKSEQQSIEASHCDKDVQKSDTEKEKELEKELEREKELELENRFSAFWAKYPKKNAKKNTHEKWFKIKPNEELFNKIMESLDNHKKSKQWTRNNGEFIPHPSTWLNQERWEDELVVDDIAPDYSAPDFVEQMQQEGLI